MTFKVNWEKLNSKHNLEPSKIEEILSAAYPNSDIKEYSNIRGGCANLNIKVQLKEPVKTEIIRIYIRDKNAGLKEKNISEILIKNSIPSPQIYNIAEKNGYTFARVEYIEGITLRDALLDNNKQYDISEVMSTVGSILKNISNIKFKKAGFFNAELEVTQEFEQDDLKEFFLNAIKNKNVQAVLTEDEIKKVQELIINNYHLIAQDNSTNLVHGDFGPENILVEEENNKLTVTAILDWEFAFSGSNLFDIANMLRYAHEVSSVYKAAFLQGLNYHETKELNITLDMLNTLALLDTTMRCNINKSSNQISDTKKLIQNILERNQA